MRQPPLCRRHHRAKTHTEWRYIVIDPGTYLWTSPTRRHVLVDHHGTRALGTPHQVEPDTDPPHH